MASKLDEAVARVAVALGRGRWAAIIPAATAEAKALKPKDLAKLPDRWHPAIGAAKADAADLKDRWDRLWFEAVAELLARSGRDGLPGLYTLLDRNDSTYHEYVVVRLLRLAADGLGPDELLARVRGRLETLRLPWVRFVVQEVEAWAPTDPRPLALLGPMASIEIPGGEGDTLATHMRTAGADRRAAP